jgi:PilZ domain
MTSDMAFECLLISRDAQVVGTLSRTLDKLSIKTNLCLSATKAICILKKRGTELVVIDWEEEDNSAFNLLSQIHNADAVRRSTIVAVSTRDGAIPGAHFVLRKPLTPQASADALRRAYSLMLRDHRRHARYPLMIPVIATVSTNCLRPVTITNIGDGGFGLSTEEVPQVGETLSLRLLLPGATRAIYIEARVLWTRDNRTAGCQFLRIPPIDLDILNDWLKLECQVKKPLVEV